MRQIFKIASRTYLQMLGYIQTQQRIWSLCIWLLFYPVMANALSLPDNQQAMTPYVAAATTALGNDAASTYPIAISSAATERGNFHLQVRTGALDAPMDAYFAIQANPLLSNTPLILTEDDSLQPLSGKLKPWKTNVDNIDDAPFDGIALSNLPVGDYTFYLLLVPAGSDNPLQNNYYLWTATMALTAQKDSLPPEDALILDKSTIFMGDQITLFHPTISANIPLTITFDDGSDYSVTITATPTEEGQVSVNAPLLINAQAPYLRSGSVNVTLAGVAESAAFFIVEPPELPGTRPGEITEMILQSNLDSLQDTLDSIATLNNEEQAAMAESVAVIQAQKEIVSAQISQISNQFAHIEMDSETVILQRDELIMIDRLMLMHLLSISAQYSPILTINSRAKQLSIDQDGLEQIKRQIADIRANANGLAENTLNAIKNVGIPGTKVLAAGITTGLGLVALGASTPVATAAAGTAALVVVVHTTGMFTTTLFLQPSIDAAKGRRTDFSQAAIDAFNEVRAGFKSLGLTFLGAAKWTGQTFASLEGLLGDISTGYNAAIKLACNTQQTNSFSLDFCALFQSASIGGSWTTTYGTMTFPEIRSGTLRAPYTNEKGVIIGTLNGQILSGIWVEPSSAQKCTSERDGSFYWGVVNFEFNANNTRFSGSWDYCGTSSTRAWTGTKN